MASSLFLLLPISLAFVIAIGVFFWWAIFAGQFDDTQAAGDSILQDQDTPVHDATGQQADDVSVHAAPLPEPRKPG